VTSTFNEAEDGSAPEGAHKRVRLRRFVWGAISLVAIGAAAIALYAWSQYRTLTSAKYQDVDYTVPSAPRLVAGPGERVLRIDPTQSSVSYAVNEKLFGQSTHRAVGTTNGINGDIAFNQDHPGASRVGEIVVNVEELHSDNNLRDARMRASSLDSHKYPLAYLNVSGLSGLPASMTDGTQYHFTMTSQLTVKQTPAAVTWNAVGSVTNGKLTATATANVKMSTWGIGPISIAGLVSTSDDVALTVKLSALDPSMYPIPDSIAIPVSARTKTNVSFKNTVMPALEANCASCHQPGQVGAAHWTLQTAADAANVSDGIGTVVGARYMPPWPASSLGVPLAHSRALDQQTIDAIVSWARAGGPLDVPPNTKITPTAGPVGPPPRADVVLKMPQPYAGSLNVPNDYRCFVLDPHFTKPTYVTGYQVLPDHRPEIHHVQIFHIDASQVKSAAAISGKDGKPGWSCYGTVSLPSTEHHHKRGQDRHEVPGFSGQAGLFAGWVPGQDPVTFPQGSGVLFQPGDALAFQVHYHYDTTPVPDASTVELQTASGDTHLKPIDIINPIAPVEIPCMPGATAPLCNRDAAIANDAQLYGPIGSLTEPALLGLCGKTVADLTATFHNGIASSSCQYSIPESGTIVGVFGHEHTLGKSFRLTLDPGEPSQKILLDIPTWNFDWQMNYTLAQPIHVTAGEKIQMNCSWDRSLDPNRPQKYIVFAEGTEDEMCFSTYAIIPDDG
jgi:mono/diheme cytochrome c family protein